MKNIFKNKKAIIISASAIVVAIAIVLVIIGLNGGLKFYSSPTIVVEDVKAKVGSTIKVPVKVYKNPGVMAYMINFEYDTTVLQYVDYEKGDFLTDYNFSTNNGTLTFVNLENSDVAKNGTMFYIKFKVLKTDKEATEITINLPEGSAGNSKEELVNFAGENGTVKIVK